LTTVPTTSDVRLCSTRRSRAQQKPEGRTAFNERASLYKLSPDLVKAWARLLRLQPDARLLLYPFNPNWGDFFSLDALVRAVRWIDLEFPVDRLIVLGPRQRFTEIAEALSACDVYLDTWPHSGGLSTVDGLRAGLPVASWRGPWQRSRQGADALAQLGLADFAAADADGAVDLALDWLNSPEAYAKAQARIAPALQSGAMFDGYNGAFAKGVARILEDDPQ